MRMRKEEPPQTREQVQMEGMEQPRIPLSNKGPFFIFHNDQFILFQLLEGKDDRLSAHIKLESKFLLDQPLSLLQLAGVNHYS